MSLIPRFILAALVGTGLAVPPDHVEGEVILQLAPGMTWAELSADKALPRLEALRQFRHIERRCGTACLAVRGEEPTDTLLARLAGHPGVQQVAPNHIRTRSGVVIPEDPNFDIQWGLNDDNGTDADISFLEAMRLARTDGSRPVIAIMDTGIDYRHPDLQPNLWINEREIPGNGIDDDANGYVDDVFGADVAGDFGAPPDGDPMDAGLSVAHGTHVAGIAAAANGNGIGVTGAYPAARLLALKASENGQFFTTFAVVNGLDYLLGLVDRGEPIAVVNTSFGGDQFNGVELAAYRALGDAGIVVTAAAGNDGSDNDAVPEYPASYDSSNIISVAATTDRDQLATFSNRGGSSVDIAAPGQFIYATRPTHLNSIAEVSWTGDEISGRGLIYAGLTEPAGLPGQLIDCGLGYANDFPAAVNGNIALIGRGEIRFSDKISHATTAGASACIIYNNEPGIFSGRLVQPGGLNIPAIAVAQAAAPQLRARLGTTVTVVNAFNEEAGYEFLSGTSMAAPMVAAAVALSADHYPLDTVAQRVRRVLDAADIVPGLNDQVVNNRRLNLRRILDGDNGGTGDTLPDWWELAEAGRLDRLVPGGDSDNDGWSDRSEFLAGTAPLDRGSSLRLEIDPTQNLTWPSLPGRQYRVEINTDLEAGTFEDVSGIIDATPPINRRPLPPAPNLRFYRLNLLD